MSPAFNIYSSKILHIYITAKFKIIIYNTASAGEQLFCMISISTFKIWSNFADNTYKLSLSKILS